MEPHWLFDEQLHSLHAIYAFLRANPGARDDLVFLGESIAAGKTLSLDKLTEAEPAPDEEDFRFVLGSFLIPGYVAVSWKFDGAIPIQGMEDTKLFTASKRVFAGGQKEETDWTSFICRNSVMARNIANAAREHKHVIVFAGGGHIALQDIKMTSLGISFRSLARYEANRGLAAGEPAGAGGSLPCKAGNVEDFLTNSGIGFSMFSTFDSTLQSYGKNTHNEDTYRRLMQAQLAGTTDSYVRAYQESEGGNVVVTPDPDAAAKLLKYEPRGSDDDEAKRELAKRRRELDDLKEHLTDKDLDAARRELDGEVVQDKSSGEPYNHVDEVSKAQRGLAGLMQRLGNAFAAQKSASPEMQELIGIYNQASQLLDRSEQYVPRNAQIRFKR